MAPRGDRWPGTCGRCKMRDIRPAGLRSMVKSSSFKAMSAMSEDCSARHHLIIAGTGRAGTSLLVKILHACGLETELDRKLATASGGALRWTTV
jgi:hypothetical protein